MEILPEKDETFSPQKEVVIIWIACNYDNNDQFDRLLETIKSCNVIPNVYHISLSIYNGNQWDSKQEEKIKALTKSFDIKLRTKRLSLFQHYEMMSNEFNLEVLKSKLVIDRNKIWITFCLDTDLLLPNITYYYREDEQCFLAQNYVTAKKTDYKPFDWTDWTVFENLDNILQHQAENMIVATDFSGTSCRFELIFKYFNRWIASNTKTDPDVLFMQYLAENGAKTTEEPVALKLLTWTRDPLMENLRNTFASIKDLLNGLS